MSPEPKRTQSFDLEWTAERGATAYRLTVLDAHSGRRLKRSPSLSEPRYRLELPADGDSELSLELELKRRAPKREPVWEPAGPPARIERPLRGAPGTRLRWRGVSPLHRLVIADQTAARTLSDEVVLGSSCEFPWSRGEQGHDLVMQVHGWKDGAWDEGTGWRPLPLEVALRERAEPQAELDPSFPPALLLVFSVDTEAWVARQRDPDPRRVVDEMIFGNFGDFEQRGIGLQMDLLEHFGFRGCFFVDVLMEHQYGRRALERTIDAIQGRGHEVQLHLHDEHLEASSDPAARSLAGDLNRKDADEFRRILELAVDLFERRTGRPPLAYRAGAYRISDDHFPVLEEMGIAIDSSVNVYWNSRVSDWMRTRTQPFWVGGVLEMPVTWTLVRDDRAAPETRAFAPNATSGDPVSSMPAAPSGVPRVASFVSHSFELMRAIKDSSPEAMAAWEGRLRATASPKMAELAGRRLESSLRVYDGKLDEELTAKVAGLLRRVADREDARCVTFSELHELADAFPRERREPTDPVPAIDRPRGAASVTGTRVYSAGLLSHLTSSIGSAGATPTVDDDALEPLLHAELSCDGREVAVIGAGFEQAVSWLQRQGAARVEQLTEPDPGRKAEFDLLAWPRGFERCHPERLEERFAAAVGMVRPGGSLLIRARTLGVGPAAAGDAAPPLREVLFAVDAVREAANGAAPAADEVVAWDATTFAAWIESQGVELVGQRRVERHPAELAALERHADKLGALAEEELEIAAVDLTLRSPGEEWEPRGRPTPSPANGGPPRAALARLLERFPRIVPGDSVLEVAPVAEDPKAPALLAPDGTVVAAVGTSTLIGSSLRSQAYDAIVCAGALERVELERVQDACAGLHRALRPGGMLLLRLSPDEARPATPTTLLVALLRQGFELLESDVSPSALDCRLVRPLDYADIERFSEIPG